uniref:Uncharacterized protein n=1 Tax=Cacopsylla melanoneura TaxID=428564 RepID=A0A8D9EE10_9HEMI
MSCKGSYSSPLSSSSGSFCSGRVSFTRSRISFSNARTPPSILNSSQNCSKYSVYNSFVSLSSIPMTCNHFSSRFVRHGFFLISSVYANATFASLAISRLLSPNGSFFFSPNCVSCFFIFISFFIIFVDFACSLSSHLKSTVSTGLPIMST